MCHVLPLVSCEQRGVSSRSGAVNTSWSGPNWSQGGKQLLLRQSGDMVLGLTQGNKLKRKSVGTVERLLDGIPTLRDGAEAVKNDSFCHTHRKPATHVHTHLIKTSFQS